MESPESTPEDPPETLPEISSENSPETSPEISSENSPETSPEISPEDSTGDLARKDSPGELTGNLCAGSCHISRHIQKLAPAKA